MMWEQRGYFLTAGDSGILFESDFPFFFNIPGTCAQRSQVMMSLIVVDGLKTLLTIILKSLSLSTVKEKNEHIFSKKEKHLEWHLALFIWSIKNLSLQQQSPLFLTVTLEMKNFAPRSTVHQGVGVVLTLSVWVHPVVSKRFVSKEPSTALKMNNTSTQWWVSKNTWNQSSEGKTTSKRVGVAEKPEM